MSTAAAAESSFFQCSLEEFKSQMATLLHLKKTFQGAS